MEYLIKEKEKIVKYDMAYNEDNLLKIRKDICNTLGIKKHIEYETDYPNWYNFDDDLVENYQTPVKVGTKEYFEETRDVYKISYDKIEEPMLAEKISKFLKGNHKELFEVLYDENAFRKKYFQAKGENKILSNINNITKNLVDNDLNINNVRQNLKTLDGLLERLEKLNIEKTNFNEQMKYTDLIKKEITWKKLGEMDFKTFTEVLEFNDGAKCLKKIKNIK